MHLYLIGVNNTQLSCNGLQIMNDLIERSKYVLMILSGILGLLAASYFPY